MNSPQKKIESILMLAGISVNGNRPWDITVHDDRLYSRILVKGSLGLGEAYMDGWWDCENIDQMLARFMVINLR